MKGSLFHAEFSLVRLRGFTNFGRLQIGGAGGRGGGGGIYLRRQYIVIRYTVVRYTQTYLNND